MKNDAIQAFIEQVKTSIDMHIYYKIINGVYYCFGTLNGYDYSFDGNTIHVATERMKAKVSELFIANKVTWHLEHPTSVSDREKIIKPPVTYKRNRLDYP